MIVWLLLAVTGLVSGAPGREQYYLPRETRLLYARTIATSVLSRTPPGARLISARGDLPPLVNRLIHNATSIRLNIVDTFNCSGRVYGYYADLDNDCQIFHICLPMQQLFPDQYGPEDLYHFSFICPGYTIFSQDSMTCDWEDSAFPCRQAPQLYHRNNHFFVVPAEDVQRTSPTPSPSPSPTPESPLNNSRFSLTPSLSPSSSPTPYSQLNNSNFSPTPNPSPNTSPTPLRRNPSLRLSPSPIPSPNSSLQRRFRPTPSLFPSSRRSSPRPIPLRRNRTRNRNPSPTPSPKPPPAPRHTLNFTLRAAASLRPSLAASSSAEP